MKEEERKEAILSIDKVLEIKSKEEEYIRRLEEIENKDLIKEYINLKEAIDFIKDIPNDEDFIKKIEFEKKIYYCEHSVWLYLKSYASCGPNLLMECENEDDERFAYNSYGCLECGKLKIIKEWKNFEKENVVLNAKYQKLIDIRKEYFKLLYENDVEFVNKLIKKKYPRRKSE